MNFISRQEQTDDQKIDDLIKAFGTYALGDIEHNILTEKPVAAFLLSSCWIDQVALFVYNHNENNLDQHYRNFITKYLNNYAEMDLYTNLRCKLVHSYSVGVNMRIAVEDSIFTDGTSTTTANYITAKNLYKDLKEAWEIVKKELLDLRSKTRENALTRFNISPTLIEAKSNIISYSKGEADTLIKYYTPLLKGKLLNGKNHLEITTIRREPLQGKSDQFVILVIIRKSKTKELSEFLDRVTQQFSLPFPLDILEQR